MLFASRVEKRIFESVELSANLLLERVSIQVVSSFALSSSARLLWAKEWMKQMSPEWKVSLVGKKSASGVEPSGGDGLWSCLARVPVAVRW